MLVSSLLAAGSAQAFDADGVPPEIRSFLDGVSATGFNLRFGADGSITRETADGTQRYVPLFMPGVTDPAAAGGEVTINPDGTVSFGEGGETDVIYVPVVDADRSYPSFPEGFTPPDGAQLPENAGLPPGFVPPAGMDIDPDLIPPLPPGDFLAEFGLTQGTDFYVDDDGSIVFNGRRFVPFLDPDQTVGVPEAGASASFTRNPDGSVGFPDGSLFVPVVTDDDNLPSFPEGFTPPDDVIMPADIQLPEGFFFPAHIPLPSGVELPPQARFGDGLVLPPGVEVEPGTLIPDGVVLPDDFSMPPGIVLPPGTEFSELPAGAEILEDGSIMIPGFVMPAGLTMPPGFELPAGAETTDDGRIILPPPPERGFDHQFQVIHHDDGSVTLPAPPDGQPIPPNATVNPDGTLTLPPPEFFGEIGVDGSFLAEIDQFTGDLPPGAVVGEDGRVRFEHQGGGGFSFGGSQVDIERQDDGSWSMTGTGGFDPTDPAFSGFFADDLQVGPGGELIMGPPPGFVPPTVNADGSITIPAGEIPDDAPLPPGAVRNPDGSVTMPPPPEFIDPTSGLNTDYMGAVINDDGTMTLPDGTVVDAPPIVDDGFAIDPATGLPVGPDGQPLVFDDSGLPIDPATGMPFIPGQAGMDTTGLTFDPTTGFPVDPATGLPIDPATGQVFDPDQGFLPPPPPDAWMPPCDPMTDPDCTAPSPDGGTMPYPDDGTMPPPCDPAMDPTCTAPPPDDGSGTMPPPDDGSGTMPPPDDGSGTMPPPDDGSGTPPPPPPCDPALDPACTV